MEAGLVRALEGGAVVVTATQRLARRLLAAYDEEQLAVGRACWPSASVLPLGAWLRSTWLASWPPTALLPEAVSLALWEELIEADAERQGIDLLDTSGAARSAREAYALLRLYRIPFSPGPYDSPEAQALGRWVRSFEGRVEAERWTEEASVPEAVAQALAAGIPEVPTALFTAGFDELAPAYRLVLSALEERGVPVSPLPFPNRAGRAMRFSAPDGKGEVRAAARWARGLLESAGARRIGVVAPRLEAYAGWVEAIFAEELVPASVLPGASEAALPFDLSLGFPLSREPLVACALDLLALSPGPVEWEVWTSLLRAPFWGVGEGGEGEAGANGRAFLDARLSRLKRHRWSIPEIAREASRVGLGAMGEILRQVALVLEGGRGKRSPSEWAVHFAALLGAARWPSGRMLTSREFQAREAFATALSGLRALDALGAPVGRSWALDRLRKLSSEPFRPESPETPIQVLGLLETAGLDFDNLWILGAHSESLPPQPRPNPFLPYELQVRAGVRQASPEAQLRRAEGLVGRLLASADDVVVSSPASWEGRAASPSPLVVLLPEGQPTLAEPASVKDALRASPVRLERVRDEAPAFPPQTEAPGGARLLADQAACPFRAFATHRLGARALGAPDLALDAAERGTEVHAAMEALCSDVGSSRELEAISPEELEAKIALAAQAGVEALEKGRAGALAPRLRRLEGARIAELLRQWLEQERRRPPYTVVERESDREVEVGGLRLRLRVDRVDECEGGERLLIDYKTGRARVSAWFEERPREPQLPLYALACPEARGACYAVLRRGNCEFQGVDAGGGLAPGLTEVPVEGGRWEDLRKLWEGRLGSLAREVLEGRADVCPAEEESCRYCDLPPLCRRAAEPKEDGEGEP